MSVGHGHRSRQRCRRVISYFHIVIYFTSYILNDITSKVITLEYIPYPIGLLPCVFIGVYIELNKEIEKALKCF